MSGFAQRLPFPHAPSLQGTSVGSPGISGMGDQRRALLKPKLAGLPDAMKWDRLFASL